VGDVLLTGAAGGVARMIRPLLLRRYGRLVLSDRAAPQDVADGEAFRAADLRDASQVAAMLQGIDRVIHLGGQSVEADWETVRQANIDGLQTFFEGCRAARVSRVVFASSVHVVGFYGRNRRIGVQDPVRPDGLYGVSKAFGEAMAALYADKHGLQCLSIRIGNVHPRPLDRRRLSIWLHPEDLVQLCAIGLEHPAIHNQVVFGMSGNARAWWDNAPAYALGYRPAHDAEDHAEYALAHDAPADPVGDLFQGGTFCSDGFDGDTERSLWA